MISKFSNKFPINSYSLLKTLCGGGLLFLIGVISCTKTQEVDPNPKDSYRYFPIAVGDYKIYQKVTFSYVVGQKEKKDTILIKETVASKSQNNGDNYFVVERQVKAKNDLFFKSESVFQYIINPKEVISTDKNLYTLLLQFPIYSGAKWNQNILNTQNGTELEVVPYKTLPKNLITDKNLLKVQGDSTNNLVTYLVDYHLFSKDIGMVYKEKTDIAYCQDDDPNSKTSCTGKYIIQSGKREFYTLIEYGKK